MKTTETLRVVIGYASGEDPLRWRQAVLGAGLECGPEDCVGLQDVAARLAVAKPDLTLVSMGRNPEHAVERVREAAQCGEASVWAVGPTHDSQWVIRALRNGAVEYLNAADFRAELDAALEKLAAQGADPRKRGKVISIFAPTPGSGATTVALNVAAGLAVTYPHDVALVELKYDGDLAVLLDMAPPYTVSDVCRRWESLDTSALDGGFLTHPSGLKVLAENSGKHGALPVPAEATRRLLVLLRRMFRFVVLDLDSRLDGERLEAMRLSEVIGLVVRLDVPSVRRAQRALQDAVARGAAKDAFRLIVNRYGQSGLLPLRKAEEALGLKVLQAIPDDPAKVNKAINHAALVRDVSRVARITRSFSRLAGLLNGVR